MREPGLRQPVADRQQDLLHAYNEWIAKYGEEPTVRDLAMAVGLSPSTVSLYVRRMRADGIEVSTRGGLRRRCPRCGY
ncbi:winged helix-turn-helix transcriptional regulator [Streptomyces sp. NPDC102384]|uniref:winged helix-turn-helix transcriptional regulator n=1 Tax=unclassified Streptomyces TaxID=2593676 RepID=UPI00382F0E59